MIFKKIIGLCFCFLLTLLLIPKYSSANEYRYFKELNSFNDTKFLNPQSVYFDSVHNEIYVADRDLNSIFVYNIEFQPLFSIDSKHGIKEPVFIKGYKNKLYLIEAINDFVKVLNYRGKEVLRINAPEGIPFKPQRLEIGNDDLIYVVNSVDNTCLVFDLKGNYIRTIGERLYSLSGIALSDDKVFLISSFDVNVIRVFNKNGDFLFTFEGITDNGGTLQLPVEGKFINDQLYILDSMQGVIIYNSDLERIAQVGRRGRRSYQVRFPVDIDLSKDNVIYLIDEYRKSLMVYKVINED